MSELHRTITAFDLYYFFILSSRRILKQLNGDDNNNTLPNPKKVHPIKQSRSHGNLVENNKFYMSDDPEVLAKERKKLVKRTKSFWKFGKNASDNEILEGMALWKHRDLVDVDNEDKRKRSRNSQERVRKASRDKSNDSDRTINNNNQDNKENGSDKVEDTKTNAKSRDMRHTKSFNEKQKMSLLPRKDSNEHKDDFEDTSYKRPKQKSKPVDFDDHFYDDEGDGLMLKTVNRKNILQQYTNDDSSGTELESDSDMTSDDPYDCIVVEDQNVQKTESHFPNVAELGKKLEKLSKNSKYSPNKDNMQRNMVDDKNSINLRERMERQSSRKKASPERQEIMEYREKKNVNSFKTFGIEIHNIENGEKERIESDIYYNQTAVKRNNEKNSQEKQRRYYPEANNNKNKSGERRGRPSYESIDSDSERRNNRDQNGNRRSHGEDDKKEKMKYYDSTNDELSDAAENRQILPRTKLTKTNSNNSTQSKYEKDIGLMEYGETLQRRLKNPEYNSKYDEKSPHNGNMYGPWYDLWGLDSTGPRK